MEEEVLLWFEGCGTAVVNTPELFVMSTFNNVNFQQTYFSLSTTQRQMRYFMKKWICESPLSFLFFTG